MRPSTTVQPSADTSVTDASLAQHASWDDLSYDMQHMVSEHVNTARIARLRSERVLTFRYVQFHQCPSTAVTSALRGLLQHWRTPAYNGPLAEILLRQLFDFNFLLRTQEDDDVDITPAEWAQVVLRITTVVTVNGPRNMLQEGESAQLVNVVSDPVPGQGQHTLMICLPQYAVTANTNRPRAWIEYSGFLSWQTFSRNTGQLSERAAAPPAAPPAHDTLDNFNLQFHTTPAIPSTLRLANPYLTHTPTTLHCAVPAVARMPAVPPHQLCRHTRAFKRPPPDPTRPPADGRADHQHWEYSWRLVVRVGEEPGQWPEHSALALIDESMSSDMDNDDELYVQVQETLSRNFDHLLVPCTPQDAEMWDQVRDLGFPLDPAEGGFRAYSDDDRYLLHFTFRHEGQRVTRERWFNTVQRVTDVVITYRGPARFRLRHPSGQQLAEHRRPPQGRLHIPFLWALPE